MNARLLRYLAAIALLIAPPSVEGSEAVAKKTDKFLQPYVDTNNFSGAVLMARDGTIVVKKAYGLANQELAVPATLSTKFMLASLSKVFTATAILVLEQDGKLAVADPISKHIPDYPRGGEITIHHLLAHRSGIPNVNQLPGWEEKAVLQQKPADLVALFRNEPLRFVPGAKFNYTNSNYMLLAMIIEKVSGMSFGDFMRQRVFEPAGMTASGHRGDQTVLLRNRATGYAPSGLKDLAGARYIDWSANTGAASIYSTVEDLYKFDRALRAGKILSAESQKKMVTDHGDEGGYGWFLETRYGRHVATVAGRSPGFNSFMERSLDDDIVNISLSNNYSSIGQNLGRQLLSLQLGEKVTETLSAGAQTMPPVPPRLFGQYAFGQDFGYNPGLVVRIEPVEGGLVMRSKAGDSFLIPNGPLQFVDRMYGGKVTLVDTAGAPTLKWTFGSEYTATRVPAEPPPAR